MLYKVKNNQFAILVPVFSDVKNLLFGIARRKEEELLNRWVDFGAPEKNINKPSQITFHCVQYERCMDWMRRKTVVPGKKYPKMVVHRKCMQHESAHFWCKARDLNVNDENVVSELFQFSSVRNCVHRISQRCVHSGRKSAWSDKRDHLSTIKGKYWNIDYAQIHFVYFIIWLTWNDIVFFFQFVVVCAYRHSDTSEDVRCKTDTRILCNI